jgi:Calcineurin-like phosphoesterase
MSSDQSSSQDRPASGQPGGLAPELLAGVMDPAALLGKLKSLEQERIANSHDLDTLPGEQRLPPGHFVDLRRDIESEAGDPDRVIRASSPAGSDDPPAPPPVIYLSRRPTVSQFMGVITHCVEEDLAGTSGQRLLHLGALEHLWRDIEEFAEELRSRFRKFGPCDIRFIEPKLAQLLAAFTGRHPFSTSPPEIRLGSDAKVFVLGDWATGLPQARNVADRIREQLALVAPGTDCHVIHLGDTYYAGLEDECRRRFLDLWPVAPGSSVKSWTLAGNHDMYGGGHGYFNVLLADPRFAEQGGCSYFALTNDYWQILGLDSAYKNPDSGELQDPQHDWLAEQVKEAGERHTILLTHHQPFSAYEEITTPLEDQISQAITPHDPVEAWLWGHEHRCAVYKRGVLRDDGRPDPANYAAMVGHGGVPDLASSPVNPDALAWRFDDCYRSGEDRWSLGGFATLTFQDTKLEIQYYDEYGKTAREGARLEYAAESASIAQVRATASEDTRPERPPDVLPIERPQKPNAHTSQ